MRRKFIFVGLLYAVALAFGVLVFSDRPAASPTPDRVAGLDMPISIDEETGFLLCAPWCGTSRFFFQPLVVCQPFCRQGLIHHGGFFRPLFFHPTAKHPFFFHHGVVKPVFFDPCFQCSFFPHRFFFGHRFVPAIAFHHPFPIVPFGQRFVLIININIRVDDP